jgi:hypothetical protein
MKSNPGLTGGWHEPPDTGSPRSPAFPLPSGLHRPCASDKFCNPLGEGVWLATELDADGDTLFGLADLGEPELGFFSLSEMQSLTLRFGMGIERDIIFEGMFPTSVWAEAARQAGSIRAAERVLFASVRLRREGL